MPKTIVVFFKEDDGSVPLVDWLGTLEARAVVKCRVKIERLAVMGYELRRPDADYLRDGIYELRVPYRSVNYRLLYFFHGNEAAVVSHGLAKERRVPPREIALALKRKQRFEEAPTERRAGMG